MNAALRNRIDTMLAREGALSQAAKTDPGFVKNAYSASETNIATLGHVCTKGPKANGDCRAPRRYRNYAKQALGWGQQEIDKRTEQ